MYQDRNAGSTANAAAIQINHLAGAEVSYTPIAPLSEKHRLAQVYPKGGLAVFPLRPNSKVPLPGTHGHLDATTDPKQIDDWWTENPDYNIGAVPASIGCTVIDTDEKEGRQGGAHFDQLCVSHTANPAPVTKVVRTASTPPGHHRWYTGTVDWDGPAGLLGEGIDVKCHGYVVMPPSTIDGKAYTWSDTHERVGLPWFVVEALDAAQAEKSKPRAKSQLAGEPVFLTSFIDMLSYLDCDEGRDQWRNNVASVRATPVVVNEDGSHRVLSELELRDVAIRWSRGEYDRQGRYKHTPPSRYDGDEAVEAVFCSMPPKAGGVGFGSLVQQARAAGYRGPISVSEEEANKQLRDATARIADQSSTSPTDPDNGVIDELARLSAPSLATTWSACSQATSLRN